MKQYELTRYNRILSLDIYRMRDPKCPPWKGTYKRIRLEMMKAFRLKARYGYALYVDRHPLLALWGVVDWSTNRLGWVSSKPDIIYEILCIIENGGTAIVAVEDIVGTIPMKEMCLFDKKSMFSGVFWSKEIREFYDMTDCYPVVGKGGTVLKVLTADDDLSGYEMIDNDYLIVKE